MSSLILKNDVNSISFNDVDVAIGKIGTAVTFDPHEIANYGYNGNEELLVSVRFISNNEVFTALTIIPEDEQDSVMRYRREDGSWRDAYNYGWLKEGYSTALFLEECTLPNNIVSSSTTKEGVRIGNKLIENNLKWKKLTVDYLDGPISIPEVYERTYFHPIQEEGVYAIRCNQSPANANQIGSTFIISTQDGFNFYNAYSTIGYFADRKIMFSIEYIEAEGFPDGEPFYFSDSLMSIKGVDDNTDYTASFIDYGIWEYAKIG